MYLSIKQQSAASDGKGVAALLQDAVQVCNLVHDDCRSFNLDSPHCLKSAFPGLKRYTFRIAVSIWDPCHVYSHGISKEFETEQWKPKTKLGAVFKHSMQRRYEYRSYITNDCDPASDSGALDKVTSNLLPSEIKNHYDNHWVKMMLIWKLTDSKFVLFTH